MNLSKIYELSAGADLHAGRSSMRINALTVGGEAVCGGASNQLAGTRTGQLRRNTPRCQKGIKNLIRT